jgi:GNAT superfamily N-acetyltransferase
MPGYRVRPATLADVDVLVHHRIGMFADMGTSLDAAAVDGAFRRWLAEMMPEGIYQAWLVETDAGDIVAGGGMTVLPWPPGPTLTNRIAFVYNVYTERSHRQRGLARRIMETIHEWCRANRIGVVLLNASQAGQPLYESMGYRPSPSVMMVMTLEP